jgi:hypothetical protein
MTKSRDVTRKTVLQAVSLMRAEARWPAGKRMGRDKFSVAIVRFPLCVKEWNLLETVAQSA